VCRVFKKRLTTMRKLSEHDSPCWYDEQVSFMQDMDSPKQSSQPNNLPYQFPYPCKKELDLPYHLHLPLENQKLLQSASNSITPYAVVEQNHVMHQVSIMHQVQHSAQQQNFQTVFGNSGNEQVADWRALDKYVASQLSQEDAPKENSFSNTNTNSTNNNNNMFLGKNNDNIEQLGDMEKEEMMPENASTSNSSCPIDMWK